MKNIKEYDLLIITHLPAFYKVNLYNSIAREKNIYVLFIGSGSAIRVDDFTSDNIDFHYGFLNDGQFEHRNRLGSFLKIVKILNRIRFYGLIVNGWDLPEFWVAIFLSSGRKGLALESSDLESSTIGLKRFLKHVFLSRLDFALPAGKPHMRLLQSLGFKGDIAEVGGVGLTRQLEVQRPKDLSIIYKAVYIGRLSSEKNLKLLIAAVNELEGIELSIVGSGEQREELEVLAASNIHFFGSIENKNLAKVLSDHHFLILPSLSETWGLVVEEALQAFRPVVVSDAVGCCEDLVKYPMTGKIFKSGSKDELKQAILEMTCSQTYNRFLENISKMNWKDLREGQVKAYISMGEESNKKSYTC